MMEGQEIQLISLHGMIPVFPMIMQEVNVSAHNTSSNECMCSDLQTEDYSPLYAWYNYVLIILCLPALSVFGVCTNIVNVFIYSRKRLQSSANTYLLFLACSDFLVILTGLFIFWIDSARSYIPELARAPYTTVYTLPFGYMAQTCSIYFTVAAAFDCYIHVCWKSLSKSYCSLRRAKQICFTIVVISIMYNSLRFPQFNLRKCFHEASQEQIIEICPTTLFFTINTIYNVYMYMVLMTLLPFLFLLCLNAIILLRQSNKDHKPGTAPVETFPAVAPAADTSGDDTITMIMVVILFLACNTLALVVNMIETFTIPDPLVLNLLSDASNFLVVFNSSVNCIIYLVFNKEYREVFIIHARKLLKILRDEYCCCCAPKRNNRGIYEKVSTAVTTNGHLIRKLSLKDSMKNGDIHEVEKEEVSSPVWRPLHQRRFPELDWSAAGCFNPSNIALADDECKGGWGTETNNYQAPGRRLPKSRWLTEVNELKNRETISITAL